MINSLNVNIPNMLKQKYYNSKLKPLYAITHYINNYLL